MATVFKYPIEVTDTVQIVMPEGAEVLCVQVQKDQPCIWAKVDQMKPDETRIFHVRGTGHLFVGNEGTYVGSFQLMGGSFIGHLFEHA